MCLRTAEETLWDGKRTYEATVNASSPRTVLALDNEVAKIAAVERNPWKSSRYMEWELRLSQPRVHVLLLEDQFYKILWIDTACFIIGRLVNCQICTVRVQENPDAIRKTEICVKVFDGNFGGTVAGSYPIPGKLTDHGYPDPEGPCIYIMCKWSLSQAGANLGLGRLGSCLGR